MNVYNSFKYFYSYLGNRIVFSLILSIFSGFLDGIGIILFIPIILSMDTGSLGENFAADLLKLVFQFFNLNTNFSNLLIFIFLLFTFKAFVKYVLIKINLSNAYSFVRKLRFFQIDKIDQINFKSFLKYDSGKIQNSLTSEISRLVLALDSYMLFFYSWLLL